MFLGWYDDNPKRATPDKVRDACAAYARRFGRSPTIALVNEAQLCEVEGIAVQVASYIRLNIVWVGEQ